MTMKRSRFVFSLLLAVLVLGACSQSKPDSVLVDKGSSPAHDPNNVSEQVTELSHVIKEHDLFHYPSLTTLISSTDTEGVKEKIVAAGGKIAYDPNLGRSTRIPFLIVELSPEKLLDEEFVLSLGLSAINISVPGAGQVKPLQANLGEIERAFEDTVYVPLEDIKIPEFQAEKGDGELLGEDVLVSVIDTGIDATHPVFQNRVVYWSDQTEETSVKLTALSEQELSDLAFENGHTTFSIPNDIDTEKQVFRGVINESLFSAQLGESDRLAGATGVDLNRNGSRDDQFVFVLGYSLSANDWVVFVDAQEEGSLGATAIQDFNVVRSQLAPEVTEQSLEGMIVFSDQNRVIAYPLLILKDDSGLPDELRVGISNGSHGTHVAGIIGGHGENVVGAAPNVKFMSMRVCSNISCTTDSILRALIESFYNPQGLIPDVVNISLGSHQKYQQDIFDFLMRDLSSKFGTVFVVSASNSGPGFRSLNSIGSLAPAIQVGAHVSKRTLNRQYALDPDVADQMPTHNLLFFSSLGPSYTGHLRPNVMAPGSAISATALNDSGSEMFNGTSMSSPIVAGAVAALLSVAKKDPAFDNIMAQKRTFIENILGDQVPQERSLLGYSLALRTALENSASLQPHYTFAQQGHGLVDVLNTYENLHRILDRWNQNQVSLFEVKINNNSKSSRIYKRSLLVDPVMQVGISLEDDGERGDVHKQMIRNTPIQVHLERVQVQSPDGSVETLVDGNLPFSLGTPGVIGAGAREGTILLSSNRRRSFQSIRKLDQMSEGNVYTAHYTLTQNGERVQSILDVVHVPIEFSEHYQEHDVPSIDPNGRRVNLAKSWKNVSVGTNEFHRYPVAVNNLDSALLVETGVSVDQAGSLYIQVYDPDGVELDFQVIMRSSEHPLHRPTVKISVPTSGNPGIYEVTLATSNWRWMGPTQYDLMISKERLKLSSEYLKMSLGGNKLLSVSHPNVQARVSNVGISALHPLIQIPEVPVVPSRWTFQKLTLPQEFDSWSDLRIFIPESEASDLMFFGRMDHRLYTLKADGTFESIAVANSGLSGETDRRFSALNSSEREIYFAFEIYGVIAETGELSDAHTKIPVHAVMMGESLSESVQVSLSSDSQRDLSLIELRAPETLSCSVDAWAELRLQTNSEKTLSLPVVVKKQ